MHQTTIKVWDALVRVGHWILVVAFAIAYLTEDDFLTVHNWAGYTILAVVVLRIIWGIIGSEHARFRNFVRGPRAVVHHLRTLLAGRPEHSLGHNPAGGAMVVALLLCLLLTTITGTVVLAIEHDRGPATWVVSSTMNNAETVEDVFEEAHEVLANLTLTLILLHIGGVVATSLLGNGGLIRAMITGRKSVAGEDAGVSGGRNKRS